MMKSIPTSVYLATLLLTILVADARSQAPEALVREHVAVMARTSSDSITLRWAPRTFGAWRLGNQNGYRIERYVMARHGTLVTHSEKTVLASSVRPLPENEWESRVDSNKYSAIAAQALYGDAFTLDLDQGDIFSIVNKVQENEQRFVFALFAADMSPAVARASGLWFTDTTARPGEKYLYRIIVNAIDTVRGSIFVTAENSAPLPPPRNLRGDFREQLVSLKWNSQADYFTAYKVERSTDGRLFTAISNTPLLTISPLQDRSQPYQYAVDSLTDLSLVYHYRVIGITPFGELSPPSAVVSGKGTLHVSDVPYITGIKSIENTALQIAWHFPPKDNGAITGFDLERAPAPNGQYQRMTSTAIAPDLRTWVDKMPGQVNYYRLKASGRDGQIYTSPVYFAQLVDSLPPAPPTGFEANVDDSGHITLSWNSNREPDIFGYRIYKAYHKSEEPAQITTEPIADTLFHDQANLHTLNETVYYRVMAIDINQNHSALSPFMKVVLPDKVKPQPPVFLPAKSDETGIDIRWIPSASEDVVRYAVYRKSGEAPAWELQKTVTMSGDSIYNYRDITPSPGAVYYYTVLAIDAAGLESRPAAPVSGSVPRELYPAVVWRKPSIDREENRLTLHWTCGEGGIERFRIYVSVNERPPVSYRTVQPDERKFSDVLIPGRKYRYRIMAEFENGQKSQLSAPLDIDY